jgi:uncharacterized protein
MDGVVHFEIPVDDVDAAKAFYGGVFGWELSEFGEGQRYVIATTTPTGPDFRPAEPGAINGALMPRTADAPGPVLVVGVESIEAHLAKVEAAGGAVVRSKTEVPGMGWYAYVGDAQGNVVGLWETMPPS